jgi:dihydroflavonol-4-reductase
MKTFVTGGTGFIGARFVRRLVEGGHEARCMVRATSNTTELERMGVDRVTGDVTDRVSLLEGMADCVWVVNLANVYSWWEPDKQVFHRVNVEGTRNVMECALEAGVSKVVHVSTAYVYGKPATVPFSEDTPVGPVRPSEYTHTKYEGDRVASRLHKERGLPLVMIYPGVVLGAGDPKLTGRFIRRFLAGRVPSVAFAEAVHTYVYVEDVAEALVRALEKEGNTGEKYLLGKDRLSVQAYNKLISEISGAAMPQTIPGTLSLLICALATWRADRVKKPPKVAPLDYARVIRDGCIFDGSKAERELGLVYTPVRDMLEEVIESFR